jgi:hypothetical protein
MGGGAFGFQFRYSAAQSEDFVPALVTAQSLENDPGRSHDGYNRQGHQGGNVVANEPQYLIAHQRMGARPMPAMRRPYSGTVLRPSFCSCGADRKAADWQICSMAASILRLSGAAKGWSTPSYIILPNTPDPGIVETLTITMFDLSNPSVPKMQGSVVTPHFVEGGYSAVALRVGFYAVQGNPPDTQQYGGSSGSRGTLFIVDARDPNNPAVVVPYAGIQGICGLAMADGYLNVATGQGGEYFYKMRRLQMKRSPKVIPGQRSLDCMLEIAITMGVPSERQTENDISIRWPRERQLVYFL